MAANSLSGFSADVPILHPVPPEQPAFVALRHLYRALYHLNEICLNAEPEAKSLRERAEPILARLGPAEREAYFAECNEYAARQRVAERRVP